MEVYPISLKSNENSSIFIKVQWESIQLHTVTAGQNLVFGMYYFITVLIIIIIIIVSLWAASEIPNCLKFLVY